MEIAVEAVVEQNRAGQIGRPIEQGHLQVVERGLSIGVLGGEIEVLDGNAQAVVGDVGVVEIEFDLRLCVGGVADGDCAGDFELEFSAGFVLLEQNLQLGGQIIELVAAEIGGDFDVEVAGGEGVEIELSAELDFKDG